MAKGNTGPGADGFGEIAAAARREGARLRDSGELAAIERALDEAFDRHSPPFDDRHIDALLDRAEEAAHSAARISAGAPVESARPGVGRVKRGLRSLLHWYIDYVAQHLAEVQLWLVASVRAVDRRVRLLEESRDPVAGLPPSGVAAGWSNRIDALVASADGTVARAETLAEARALPMAELGALVLSEAAVERLEPPEVFEVAALTARCLAPGGQAVLCSAHPGAWGGVFAPVAADLAVGRPIHAETWRYVFETEGLVVDAVTSDDPDAPTSYLLTARKPT